MCRRQLCRLAAPEPRAPLISDLLLQSTRRRGELGMELRDLPTGRGLPTGLLGSRAEDKPVLRGVARPERVRPVPPRALDGARQRLLGDIAFLGRPVKMRARTTAKQYRTGRISIGSTFPDERRSTREGIAPPYRFGSQQAFPFRVHRGVSCLHGATTLVSLITAKRERDGHEHPNYRR